MPLDPVTHANEYKKIADEVAKTSPITITKIQRVQNPTLYRVYMVRKEQMEQKKGSNEKTLFHGTAEGSCASINKTGFNRSYCGKNGMYQLESHEINATDFFKGSCRFRAMHGEFAPPSTQLATKYLKLIFLLPRKKTTLCAR